MFTINENTNSGVSMKFDNGNTISIQWGRGTYSSNKLKDINDCTQKSMTAEVMIFNGDESLDPWGWLDSNKVAKLIAYVSTTKWDDIYNEFDDYNRPKNNFFNSIFD